MIQTVTQIVSTLYTIQPGDGTLYTFMLSRQTTQRHGTDIYTAEAALCPRSDCGSYMYQRITGCTETDSNIHRDHFSGYTRKDSIYLVTIFSPRPTAFTVSESMLADLRSDNMFLVDYLKSHLQNADRYTLYVVLAVLEALKPMSRLPTEAEMQKALIACTTIVYHMAAVIKEES